MWLPPLPADHEVGGEILHLLPPHAPPRVTEVGPPRSLVHVVVVEVLDHPPCEFWMLNILQPRNEH